MAHWDHNFPWRTGNEYPDEGKVKKFVNVLFKLDLSDQVVRWDNSDLGGIYFDEPNDRDKS